MSTCTVKVGNFEVEVEIHHFRPEIPMRWGATPEDSSEAECYELDFTSKTANHTGSGSETDDEFPSRDDIEKAVVKQLH